MNMLPKSHSFREILGTERDAVFAAAYQAIGKMRICGCADLNRVNADVLRFFADVMGTNDIVDWLQTIVIFAFQH